MLSTRKITVSVTDTHMQEGALRHCFLCPIALAIYDALGIKAPSENDDPVLGVVGSYMSFYEVLEEADQWGNRHYCTELPDSVNAFIRYFDMGFHSLAPFSFEIEVPESLIRG